MKVGKLYLYEKVKMLIIGDGLYENIINNFIYSIKEGDVENNLKKKIDVMKKREMNEKNGELYSMWNLIK